MKNNLMKNNMRRSGTPNDLQYLRHVALGMLGLLFLTLSLTGVQGRASSDNGPQAIDPGEGESLYSAHCLSCHQQSGQGVPGAFPPLADHVPVLVSVEGGRDYLMNVVLYGLQGQIEVSGQPYSGMMPGFGQLEDAEVADVLNYTFTAWDNRDLLPEDFAPYTTEEIEEQRGLGLSPQEVYELRQDLDLEIDLEAGNEDG